MYDKKINIAVCDDESRYANFISKIIGAYFDEKKIDYHVDLYGAGEEILKSHAKNYLYTVIFLDINMKNLNGIEVAEKIRIYNEQTFIVFVTAYIDYSLEGYRVNAFRYILKDTEERSKLAIYECLNVITQKLDICNDSHMLKISFVEGEKEVNLNQLICIESNLHKLIFCMMDKNGIQKYSYYGKLDDIEKQIIGKEFLRIHQSVLVNMKYIESYERDEIIMLDGSNFHVPRVRSKNVKSAYILYKGKAW